MEKIMKKIVAFRDERDWKQFHNLKDLAISLDLEAAELLENFQWRDDAEALQEKESQIKDELADVMIYGFLFADLLGVDLETVILAKLEKNKKKYPLDKFKGSKSKYNEIKTTTVR